MDKSLNKYDVVGGTKNDLTQQERQIIEDLQSRDIIDSSIPAFFEGLGSKDTLTFQQGKILMRTDNPLMGIGLFLLTICSFVAIAVTSNKLVGLCLAAITATTAIIILTLVKSYFVFDYSNKKFYMETHFIGKKFYKYVTDFSEISEVGISFITQQILKPDAPSRGKQRHKPQDYCKVHASTIVFLKRNAKVFNFGYYCHNQTVDKLVRRIAPRLAIIMGKPFIENDEKQTLISDQNLSDPHFIQVPKKEIGKSNDFHYTMGEEGETREGCAPYIIALVSTVIGSIVLSILATISLR